VSRIANNPVSIPSGVEIKIEQTIMRAKGPKGDLQIPIHPLVAVAQEDGSLTFKAQNSSKDANALAGTTRALAFNLVKGVSDGFERRLEIQGVGYRAQAQGSKLNLTLGFSHPVVHEVPKGITVETPTQTEIIVKGADKQQVGQTAAEIRAYRPPEPYKGKGVRYQDEYVLRKQAKKK